MMNCLGNHTLFRLDVFLWLECFRIGHESVKDDKDSNGLTTSQPDANIDKISELEEDLAFIYTFAKDILVSNLELRCDASKLVPRDPNCMHKGLRKNRENYAFQDQIRPNYMADG